MIYLIDILFFLYLWHETSFIIMMITAILIFLLLFTFEIYHCLKGLLIHDVTVIGMDKREHKAVSRMTHDQYEHHEEMVEYRKKEELKELVLTRLAAEQFPFL